MSSSANVAGSIRKRLALVLLAGAAGIAIVIFFVVQGFARQLAEESQDNILAASVTAILDAAGVRNGEVTIDLPYSAFSMLGNVSDDRVFYAVRLNEELLTGYADLPRPEAPGTTEARFETASYQSEVIRMSTASRAMSVGGQPVRLTVTVAQTRQALTQTLAQISRTVLGFGIGFFILSALLSAFATEAAVSPLDRLTVSVARRGPADLRPVATPVPAEMGPLVTALNRFMARLATSLMRSEDFIAEAAHRVRTPLATVRTQAEITLRRVDKDENRAALREMIRAIDDSSRAAGQLLDHAMVSFRTDHLEEEDIDLSKLAADLVERLWPLADLRDIALNLNSDAPAPIRGDSILLQSALYNLLDNAIKYAPTDSAVEMTIRTTSSKAQVIVSDRGSGFPTEGASGLTRRFERGSNTEGIVGSGLGLTIVDEVARAHNATLSIANNPDGVGACVTLCFALRS